MAHIEEYPIYHPKLRISVSGQVKYNTLEDIKMTYEELCDKLENGTPEEKNDAELELLGRVLYYEGD